MVSTFLELKLWNRSKNEKKSSERREQRNDVPPFAPVNQKIPVRRENLAVVVQFCHAHEARIGQAHRLVGIFAKELPDVGLMSRCFKIHFHQPALKKVQQIIN